MNRRDFLQLAGTGVLLGSARSRLLADVPDGSVGPRRALRILILGGTGFIGPYQVRYAVARGHRVTVFNRGRRQADLPEGVEHLSGDRNGDLSALRGREWDVVIDNPTTLPVWVRDAASLLKDRVGQYVFISTVSVFADQKKAWLDEDHPVAEYRGRDPMAETGETLRQDFGSLYGPLKALSEREAERWFPGRTTVIRPGLIVGPGDPTDRFTYWPVRVARGGEVLAPPAADPVQLVDVRDLSEWTVRMAEGNRTGVYNALGPAEELPVRGLLDPLLPLAEAPVRLTHADGAFLAAQGVRPWVDLPVWIPPSEGAGQGRVSNRRAVAAGLTFRPVSETGRDTLAWFRGLPAERQARLQFGLSPERERAVLEAWHVRRDG
jgi:2'-hydroxyisoflavone reductase